MAGPLGHRSPAQKAFRPAEGCVSYRLPCSGPSRARSLWDPVGEAGGVGMSIPGIDEAAALDFLNSVVSTVSCFLALGFETEAYIALSLLQLQFSSVSAG